MLELFTPYLDDLALTLVGAWLVYLTASGWRRARDKVVQLGKATAAKRYVPGRTVSIAIFNTGTAPYVAEVSSELTSLVRKRLFDGGLEAIVSHVIVPEDEDIGAAADRADQELQRLDCDLLVTVGSTATLAVAELRRRGVVVPPHVFVAIAKSLERQISDASIPGSVAPEMSGVTFSVTQAMRLAILVEAFSPRRVLFLAGQGVTTDRLAFEEMSAAARDSAPNIRIDLLTLTGADISTAMFDGYDVVVGWYFLHREIARILTHSTVPVFGGGAIDARGGATLALADDERALARVAVDRVIVPCLLQNKSLTDIPFMSPAAADGAYRPKLFASRSSLRSLRRGLPRRLQRQTHFYR